MSKKEAPGGPWQVEKGSAVDVLSKKRDYAQDTYQQLVPFVTERVAMNMPEYQVMLDAAEQKIIFNHTDVTKLYDTLNNAVKDVQRVLEEASAPVSVQVSPGSGDAVTVSILIK